MTAALARDPIGRSHALRLVLDAWRATRGGRAAVLTRQRARLAAQIAFARSASPYYRERYRDVRASADTAAELPVTNKPSLMREFDAWVTDPAVRIADLRRFVEQPRLIGTRFLARYTVATTSGTTGQHGIFLIDSRSHAVTSAMMLRMLRDWLSLGDVLRIARGRRLAMINAMGGHFASAVAATRLTRTGTDRVAVYPVDMPVDQIVAGLNRFQPAVLASYASMAALLATEQEARRLAIDPVLVVLSAEGIPLPEQRRIATVFGATVRDSYAATECPFLSYRCAEGWLHVNNDWVIAEPVDADHRPVAAGTQSHTVLLTNLANRIQPILRYDLGDSVIEREDPCPCGSPLQAIRVQGRTADTLMLTTRDGRRVPLPPLLLATLPERVAGVDAVQVLQADPGTLHVRVRLKAGAGLEPTWERLAAELSHLLETRGASGVHVVRAPEPPELTAGGKLRIVIPFEPATPTS
jgi:putative adenylate-forming enzyme